MLKLYYAPNTCALAVHIVLEEAAAEYDTVRIDFGAAEQRQAGYLAINPKGREVQLMQARIAVSQKQFEKASKILEADPSLKSVPAGFQAMVEVYQIGRAHV